MLNWVSIFTSSDQVFVGYYKNPETTREAVDEDGWLHSGGIGELDEEGDLRIVDRKKDVLITKGKKIIAPSKLENQMNLSSYIKEAVVIGDRRKFLSGLIQVVCDNAGTWALE
ncbi:MAG: hypothetical protein V2J25_16320 [Desulfatiglans sp.]|jgi:long-chain acyl-CoA synthetase|nr:AMP-binding protein [Thermodesulfobacteriota bacterium]MEE4354426.1 hypothetical protein [Desulfatiglans sp.]